MPHTMHPILDKVVVKREEPEEVTKGGIVIPETAKGKPLVGDVIAIGPEVQEFKVGDKVMVYQHSGGNVKVDGVEYLYCVEKDIIFILREKD